MEYIPKFLRYVTLLRVESLMIYFYTFLTTLKMYGLELSSLYAPTPKFTFLESVSALNAVFTPMIGSGGAIGTFVKMLVKTIF